MDLRTPLAIAAPALLLVAALAGCASKPYDPFDYKETGKTVELNMRVVDLYETELYPGLNANLWAFCVEPVDPNDAYSAAAIHPWDLLPSEQDTSKTSWGADRLDAESRKHCSVPGPTIEVNQGDHVVVHFSHSHVHPHTIHWHGQYVPAEMDGAPGVSQTAVESGGSITYDFIAKRAGTLWYHCHVDTQVHVMEGLYGMFIVKPQDTRFEPKVDGEAYMVLSTAKRSLVEAVPGVSPHSHPVGFVSGNIGFQNPPQFLEPDVFLLNGHSFPLTEHQPQSMYHIAEGEKLRLRILNAGNTVEEVHVHGHDMLVTHEDGLPLASPYWVDTLAVGPAERFDVVIEGNNPGAWMVHTHVNDHETNDHQSPGGMHTMLVYHGYEDQCAECLAELPGGMPYQKPVYMPQDFVNTTVVPLNPSTGPGGLPAGNANVDAHWAFPVELPCGVRFATIEAFLEGGSAAGVPVSSVTVTVHDVNGTDVGHFNLGRNGAPAGSLRLNGSFPGSPFPLLLKGRYSVDLAGTAAQTAVHLKSSVDYYASFDEMKVLHELDKSAYPLKCGKYGNGSDGLPPPDRAS